MVSQLVQLGNLFSGEQWMKMTLIWAMSQLRLIG